MSEAKTSWNVFFRGPEKFKEHIQVTAEDGASLAKARTAVLDVLKEIGATPEEEKKPYSGGGRSYSAGPVSGTTDPMVAAAAKAGVSKICPTHNVTMRYVPGTAENGGKVSQTSGKPYSSSWRCPEQGCKSVEWIKGT